jgi:hypothetical protein
MARTVGYPIGNLRGRLSNFSDESAATTEKYNKRIIFLTAATKSAYYEIVRYSVSFSLPQIK